MVADALFAQRHTLVYSETVLLIDDDQRQVVEINAFLEECMSADDELCVSIGNGFESFSPGRCALAAAQPRRADAQRFEPGGETAPVLFGEQLRRRHDCRLHIAGNRIEAGDRGDDGLAGADVTLYQAHHRMRPRHISQDLFGDASLRCG